MYRSSQSGMEGIMNEVMFPVVQRSVTIAVQTTKALVLKDYAVESDERVIYSAAHTMVESLAGNLACVTCKDPLRVSISKHFRSMFQSLNLPMELVEKSVNLVTNDYLDLACALIERAAILKAHQTIDGEIAAEIALRSKKGK